MSRGLFITGTDTGVGKTVITAGLAYLLRTRGYRVAAIKAIETGWDGPPTALPPDAALLAKATGFKGESRNIVPVFYPEPVAPAAAAARHNQAVPVHSILQTYAQCQRDHDIVLVEGAGGLMVPISETLDMAGLAKEMDLPLLVIGRAGLGTLNHTGLTLHYSACMGLTVQGVVLNFKHHRPSDISEESNAEWLTHQWKRPVWQVPRLSLPGIEQMAEALSSVDVIRLFD